MIVPDDGTKPLVDYLAGAKASIDIAIYQIDPTWTTLTDALHAAQKRGVKVRILMSAQIFPPTASNANPSEADQLRAMGFDVALSSPQFSYAHWKMIIRDAGTQTQSVMICDFNLAQSYFGVDPNDPSDGETRGMSVIDTNTADVDLITATYNADWPPYATWPASTRPNLIWSPTNPMNNDGPAGNSSAALEDVILGARQTLDIYIQLLEADASLAPAVIAAAAHGVAVRIVGNPRSEDPATVSAFQAAGVKIVFGPSDPNGDGNTMYIHTKTMIADGGTPDGVAYIGSVNPFLDQSLQTERELGALATDSATVARIQQTFDRDFAKGTPA